MVGKHEREIEGRGWVGGEGVGGVGYGRMEGVESGWAGGGGGRRYVRIRDYGKARNHIRRRNKDGGCQEYHATTRGALGDSEARKNASGVITGHCFDG